ncbi:MAG: lipase family alpha/beta hydrolase [Arenicellales bacterium]
MKAKTFLRDFLLIISFSLPGTAIADVVVLIHGYHSGAYAWETSGVSSILQENGWPRAGLYAPSGRTMQYFSGPVVPQKNSLNRSVVVDLPSEAPVALQADLLNQVLNDIRLRYPLEAITLAGHSAGAIVARTVLVRGNAAGVNRLISIAAPNLGTERTLQALNVTDIPWPFSMAADFFAGEGYHTVKRSRHLLIELLPATPGTYLGWLNSQPHPQLEYIAIVRGQNLIMSGDWMVPGISQDLNNVVAIAGQAKVISVPSAHELSPLDGVMLASILNED